MRQIIHTVQIICPSTSQWSDLPHAVIKRQDLISFSPFKTLSPSLVGSLCPCKIYLYSSATAEQNLLCIGLHAHKGCFLFTFICFLKVFLLNVKCGDSPHLTTQRLETSLRLNKELVFRCSQRFWFDSWVAHPVKRVSFLSFAVVSVPQWTENLQSCGTFWRSWLCRPLLMPMCNSKDGHMGGRMTLGCCRFIFADKKKGNKNSLPKAKVNGFEKKMIYLWNTFLIIVYTFAKKPTP